MAPSRARSGSSAESGVRDFAYEITVLYRYSVLSWRTSTSITVSTSAKQSGRICAVRYCTQKLFGEASGVLGTFPRAGTIDVSVRF